MSRIRGKDTTPEKRVRSLLRRLGYRLRLNVRIPIEAGRVSSLRAAISRRPVGTRGATRPAMPSTLSTQRSTRFVRPDIVLVKPRIAIFVHGCFWHRHRGCKNCTTPTHRRAWWLKKLEGNAARDKVHQRALRKLGWRPVVIWECETDKPKTLERLGRKFARPTR